MHALLEQIINGIMMGSIYVLVALGMVLIYGVMHVMNFSHGVLLMLGGYLAHFFATKIFGNYFLSILFSAAALVIIGSLMENSVFRPLRDNFRNQVTAALGIILIIQNLVIILWGPTALIFTVEATSKTVRLGYLRFSLQHVLIIVVAFAIVGGLFLFLTKTTLGTAIRATSQHYEAAQVVGIHVTRIYNVTFAIGAALAAIGGALLGPLFLLFPGMGDLPLIKALAAILLGGMGSIFGVVVGGMVIGISEAVSTLLIPTDYRDAITFFVIIAILLFRPHGIFGTTVRDSS